MRLRGDHAVFSKLVAPRPHAILPNARLIGRFQRFENLFVIVDSQKYVGFAERLKQLVDKLLRQTTRHDDFFQFSVFIIGAFQNRFNRFRTRAFQKRAGVDD